MRVLLPLVVLLVLAFNPLGGCSVFMALEGTEASDMSVLEIGAPRDAVEMEFGEPVTETGEEGATTTATYLYSTDSEGSVLRACAHGLLDFLTFGIWEIAGITIESVVDDSVKREVLVMYDVSGSVIAVEPFAPDLPTREERYALVGSDVEPFEPD